MASVTFHPSIAFSRASSRTTNFQISPTDISDTSYQIPASLLHNASEAPAYLHEFTIFIDWTETNLYAYFRLTTKPQIDPSDPQGDPDSPGPELSTTWEQHTAAITLTNDTVGPSVTIPGPSAPVTFPDGTEPYAWGSSDFTLLANVSTWVQNTDVGNAISLTLNDGQVETPDDTDLAPITAELELDAASDSVTVTAPPPTSITAISAELALDASLNTITSTAPAATPLSNIRAELNISAPGILISTTEAPPTTLSNISATVNFDSALQSLGVTAPGGTALSNISLQLELQSSLHRIDATTPADTTLANLTAPFELNAGADSINETPRTTTNLDTLDSGITLQARLNRIDQVSPLQASWNIRGNYSNNVLNFVTPGGSIVLTGLEIPPPLVKNSATSFLKRFSITGYPQFTNVIMGLQTHHEDVSNIGNTAGPDFTDAWERSDFAITLQAPHGTITIPGPAQGNEHTEPYQWNPPAASRQPILDWLSGLSSTQTIRVVLRDSTYIAADLALDASSDTLDARPADTNLSSITAELELDAAADALTVTAPAATSLRSIAAEVELSAAADSLTVTAPTATNLAAVSAGVELAAQADNLNTLAPSATTLSAISAELELDSSLGTIGVTAPGATALSAITANSELDASANRINVTAPGATSLHTISAALHLDSAANRINVTAPSSTSLHTTRAAAELDAALNRIVVTGPGATSLFNITAEVHLSAAADRLDATGPGATQLARIGITIDLDSHIAVLTTAPTPPIAPIRAELDLLARLSTINEVQHLPGDIEPPDPVPPFTYIPVSVWLRRFPSHELVTNLPAYLRITWETRWQQVGQATIVFQEGAIDRPLLNQLITASHSIELVIHTDPIHRYYGLINSVAMNRASARETFTTNPVNIIHVVNGYNRTGITQEQETYVADNELANYRHKEIIHIDQDLDTAEKREAWAVQEFRKRGDLHNTAVQSSLSTFQEPSKLYLECVDILGVLRDYWVTPPDGEEAHYTIATDAGPYVQLLLEDRIAEDINATIRLEHPGHQITEPVRYRNLYETVARALRYGDLGITSQFDPDSESLLLRIHRGADRRSGPNFTTFTDRLDLNTLQVGDIANRPIWHDPTDKLPMRVQTLQCIGLTVTTGVTEPTSLDPTYRDLAL